jgi:hypothetical protein
MQILSLVGSARGLFVESDAWLRIGPGVLDSLM